MRKFRLSMKRFFAGILTTAMVTSAMALSGFAVDEVITDTIDTSKEVSLTIHKYEYNDTDGNVGTGSANDEVPDGAKTLSGVEFTVYKVADIVQETDANGNLVGLKYKTTAGLKTAGVTDYIDGGMNATAIKAMFIDAA